MKNDGNSIMSDVISLIFTKNDGNSHCASRGWSPAASARLGLPRSAPRRGGPERGEGSTAPVAHDNVRASTVNSLHREVLSRTTSRIFKYKFDSTIRILQGRQSPGPFIAARYVGLRPGLAGVLAWVKVVHGLLVAEVRVVRPRRKEHAALDLRSEDRDAPQVFSRF